MGRILDSDFKTFGIPFLTQIGIFSNPFWDFVPFEIGILEFQIFGIPELPLQGPIYCCKGGTLGYQKFLHPLA